MVCTSTPPTTTPAPTSTANLIAGDINGDGTVSVVDYRILMGCWLPNVNSGKATCAGYQKAADLNGDGVVNQVDYILWMKDFIAQQGK
jgi:hypothetical protein